MFLWIGLRKGFLMFSGILMVAFVLSLGALALRASQNARMRRVSLQRIGLQVEDGFLPSGVLFEEESSLKTYPRRYWFAPPCAALLAAALVYWLTNLPVPFLFGFGILAAAVTYLVETYWADRKIEKIESQLADTLDLLVASLRAGSALLNSLEVTVRDARMPIREELETVVARLRVGDDPQTVVKDLSARVPLESFRLFAHCLMVHWETGGSLAGSLKTVSRTVRDRLEVSRRISAQAIESQVSVVAVMAITYGLMFFMLYSNPDPVKKLLYSQIGSYVAAGLMIMQAIGMVWIWRMSRIRF